MPTPLKTDSDFYRSILETIYDGVYFIDRDRRITYWNAGAERITGYRPEDVIGRPCRDNLLMHVDSEGNPLCGADACPAAGTMSSGRPCAAEVYLHHRDGHRVPVVTRIFPIYDEGEIAGAVEVFTDNSAVVSARRRIEELERLALLDQLTGLGNRRHAEAHIRARLDQLTRYGWPFALLFFDIDRFKRVNDTYGHEAGDEVLKAVARSTEGGLRSFDIVSRWGGEEFTAVVVNVEERLLGAIAGKVRALVESSSVTRDGQVIEFTISLGATMARVDDSVETLVKRADDLMYASKSAGRNRFTVG